MVTAPFVSEITDEQIVSYFNEMAPLSKTGILVYNAPGIGITLSPALLERLAEIPNVVGIKQGDLNPYRHRSDCQPPARAAAFVLCLRSGFPRADDGRV